MRKVFGLLGAQLEHSFSPLIHSYLGDYDYPLYEIEARNLETFMQRRSFDGLNVTIPYKQAVIPYCAALSDKACRTGSVNTIIKAPDGLLYGYNTDYQGFKKMLAAGGIDPRGKKTLVLGDGGAARTVRTVLAELYAQPVITISRRGENHYENIDRHYDARLIVNTTPVGMYPHQGSAPLSLAGFRRLSGVADLIYNPRRSKLLLEANQLGIPAINGLTMLIAQAELASRLFLNIAPRPQLVNKLSAIIKNKTQNIALIGLPGCGKSTVGRLLAQRLGRPLADTDEKIAALKGMSIARILAEEGEPAFRQLETQVLSEEAAKNGVVIATGGGVVTQPANRDLLQQNSLIIYLKRPTSELTTAGRPLSQSLGLPALAHQRLPLYEAWCDRAVTVAAQPEQTIKRILEAIR